MTSAVRAVGDHLREWRQRRRLSQLDLACAADISTKHLSFLETGRSQPSRDMVLHLADRLEIPLRDRNILLVAAGYAPVFPERPLGDPALGAARKAIDLVLAGHEPYPAPLSVAPAAAPEYGDMVVPFRLTSPAGVLSFFTTTTVFGTPVDITLAELALESFFPADAPTADSLRRLAEGETAAALPRRSAAS